jgi:catechol 2,3-dioxygenase-like lactoylglutathione lyase family enzyme
MTAKFSLLLAAGALSLAAANTRADVGPNTKLDADGAAFANVSISVSDLDKSTKFYTALGFTAGDTHPVPPIVGKALGAKGDVKLEIKFLQRDGVTLELLHFTPAPTGKASEGSAVNLGLAHIAFRVDDVDRFAKLVNDNGGKTMDANRTKLGPMDILIGADPDGTLMEIAGPAKK